MSRRNVKKSVHDAVLDRDDWRCVYCGQLGAYTVDHVIPVSRGGTNLPENLATSCRRCNALKLDFTPVEWRDWTTANGHPWPPVTLLSLLLTLAGVDE